MPTAPNDTFSPSPSMVGVIRGTLARSFRADSSPVFEITEISGEFFRIFGRPVPSPGDSGRIALEILRGILDDLEGFAGDPASSTRTIRHPMDGTPIQAFRTTGDNGVVTLMFVDIPGFHATKDANSRFSLLREMVDANMRAFFDLSTDLLWVMDDKGSILDTNAADRLGYEPGEVLGKSVLDFHPEEVRAEALRVVTGMLEGDESACLLPLQRKNGERVQVETRVSRGVWDGRPAIFGASRETGAHERLKSELDRRIHFQDLLVAGASALVRAEEDTIDATLDSLLGDAGTYSGSDRAYIFTIDEAAKTTSNTHEWCAPGLAHEKEAFQDLPTEFFAETMPMVQSGRSVQVTDLDEMPAAWKHGKEMLKRNGLKSMLIVPIRWHSDLLGFMGFDSVRAKRTWSEESIWLLEVLAENLAATWVRLREYRRLRDAMADEKRLADAAEAASRSKNELISIVGHEIRTPLNGIINAARFLGDGITDPAKRRYVDMMNQSSSTLLKVVNDVLDLSKIEFGKMEIEYQEFDIRGLVEQCLEPHFDAARQKSLVLDYAISPEAPERISSDPSRLTQILGNLVSNAVKYTESGYVRLSVDSGSRKDGTRCIRFTVSDSGPGLPESVAEHLFERFNRERSRGKPADQSVGMGLRIVKKLAELLDGEVEVRSRPGQGTSFGICMPEACACPGEDAENAVTAKCPTAIVIAGRDEGCMRSLRETLMSLALPSSWFRTIEEAEAYVADSSACRVVYILMEDLGSIPARMASRSKVPGGDIVILARMDSSAGRAGTAGGLASIPLVDGVIRLPVTAEELVSEIEKHIPLRGLLAFEATRYRYKDVRALIVEDNPINAEISRTILEEAGIRVDCTGNSSAALECFARASYDFVLMDIKIEGPLDGYGLTRAIRASADPVARRVPVIALSAHTLVEDRERCLGAGMNVHLSQPIDPGRLHAAIGAWINPGKRAGILDAPKSSCVTENDRGNVDSMDAAALEALPAGSAELFATAVEAIRRAVAEREPKACEESLAVLTAHSWDPSIRFRLASLAARIDAYDFERAEQDAEALSGMVSMPMGATNEVAE